jgi:hypothetical protein
VMYNPVETVSGLSGDIVNELSLTFADGTSATLGGNYPGGGPFSFSYPGEILSSIHVNGVSWFYSSADSCVFGFRYRVPQIPVLNQVIAFDYNSSGKMDHLFLCAPGTGCYAILQNSSGTFTAVGPVSNGSGIDGYDLADPMDRVCAFDYDSSGKLDHLVLYRPGTGTIFILRNNHDGSFSAMYNQGNGIGGFDLSSPADRVFAFDYDSSGKMDHLVLYRPGTGAIYIVEKNNDGTFSAVYKQGDPGTGIGGFDLSSPADRAFAFDYYGNGKMDHLVLYRPGTGAIYIVEKNNDGTFSAVYKQSDPGTGIGGFDLSVASDQLIALDYGSTGRMDYLAAYRPGNSVLWIIENNKGTFSHVFADNGFGATGFDYLATTHDNAFAFDFDGSSKLDHLVFYRQATCQIAFLNQAGITTTVPVPVYAQKQIEGYQPQPVTGSGR